MKQKVIISTSLEQHLADSIAEAAPDRLFVLCDETTADCCWKRISHFRCLHDATVITIKPGDNNKDIEALTAVWDALQRNGATRHSMLINLGGGMVTDLGGFAASAFKRGIHFVNIPTTLLSLVDASVGGKTGVNFGGLKNEIGVFNTADAVILDTQFLSTLSSTEIRSGYAEMIKHGLINPDTSMLASLLRFDIGRPELTALQQMVADSVAVKQRIVDADPLEKGVRKALNLGHTIGHAFESFAMSYGRRTAHTQQTGDTNPKAENKAEANSAITPIPHGYAVAYGIVCELYLSCVKTGFPQDIMRQTARYINEWYGRMPLTCDDYDTLFELMTHDKKNTAGTINFTLLSSVGGIEIDQTATREEIYEALDFYREG